MSTTTLSEPALQSDQKKSQARIISIDILRGFIMLTMLFVNDVAGTPKIWWWSKHFYPYDQSGMTYVDVVFPAFLFIVGMSIPFALSKQLKNKSFIKALAHILIRSASLLLLGFFTVNGPDFEKMGWYNGLWHITVYGSCMIIWLSFPINKDKASIRKIVKPQYIIYTIKALAIIALFFAWYDFQDANGNPMQPRWWGILGLIGWAYLATSIIYLLVRENLFAISIACAICIAIYLGHRTIQPATWGLPADPAYAALPAHNFMYKLKYVPMATSINAAIALMGTILALVIKNGVPNKHNSFTNTNTAKLKFAIIYALALTFAGYCLQYPHGILKNAGTPSWALYSAAITVALWAIFFLLFDILNNKKLGGILAYTGQNALLAYLFAPFFLFFQIIINTFTCINPNLEPDQQFWVTPMAFAYEEISMWGHTITFPQPYVGVAKSLAFAILTIAATAYLARKKIFLKL